MKKKLPVIIIAAVLAVCIFAVTKSITDKKTKEKEYTNLGEKASVISYAEQDGESSEKSYEYIQLNPENGLAVIYTFSIFPESDGVTGGKITIDGNGIFREISCAVVKEETVDIFIFGKELTEATDNNGFSVGDILVKLHSKDGRILPEWINLQPLFQSESVIPNF